MENGYAASGQLYWGASPYNFYYYSANVRNVYSSGNTNYSNTNYAIGARPVISLSPTASFSEGDGSYSSPFVVGEKITRTIS